MEEDQFFHRRKVGLLIACSAVFCALFFINYVDYIRAIGECNYIEWDMETVTASDYTIEFDLDPKFYKDWQEQEMEAWNMKCI